MQLTQLRPVHARSGDVELRPGQPVAAPPQAPSSGSAAFTQRHWRDLVALQGLMSYGYLSAEPNVVFLRFDGVEHARLANDLLRDQVGGVTLKFIDRANQPFDVSQRYGGSSTDLSRTLAAMPGVLTFDYPSAHNVFVRTASAKDSERLAALVEPVLGDARIFWQHPAK